MMNGIRVITTLLLIAVFAAGAAAQENEPLSIAEHTRGMARHEGFVPYYWDANTGTVWLELSDFGREFLYVNYLSRGLGSNDVGLDRGQIGGSYVVYWRRIGNKVLMMERNYDYRATADDPAQQTTVDESFAQSTLWGFTVEAEDEGRVLVDATEFLLRDARDVIGQLGRRGQGRFSLDESRSAIDPERTRNFPQNTEFDALLTFTADTAGYHVRRVAPTPTAFTIGQHHSFVQLPDNEYTPRRNDPRSGYFGISYTDHSAPLGASMDQHFIARHRLQKTNPGPAPSRVVEPIVYYVDRGAPEPMRSALVEGASWWNEAFSAAGFIDAFRVELLPEDADPLDVRYNTIQWVHRSTRGWSYGGGVIDPRTGEILKGHVTLGSLRARQDYLIAEGILTPYGDGDTIDSRMQELALARLRQLSCHEVGHTLGLRHNFAASTLGRESVMDYPYPYVTLDGDEIDVSEAYDVGVGEWDKAVIRYGYQDVGAEVNVNSALSAYLDSIYATGLVYGSDQDARATGSAHPLAHLWDNGANPTDELNRLLHLRRAMLEQFSEQAIRSGEPLVTLEETLVPIYMFHRYQLEAVPKLVGGVDYRFAVRGGAMDPSTEPVSGDEQWLALRALIAAIEPNELIIPDGLLSLMQPQTVGYVRPNEIFERRTGDVFDLSAAAESVTDMPIRYLLHPARAARLEAQHAVDESIPSVGEVIDELIEATFKSARREGREGDVQRTVDNLVLHHLIRLANTNEASSGVRAVAYAKLEELNDWLAEQFDGKDAVHFRYALRRIEQFLDDPAEFESYSPVDAPAGSPIGDGREMMGCGWR
ncbi:MAG: DUF5117 domain-containing protein [candidate division Zixibacteria bacterium]|nr:DUF5117 domain-containing protein [candidate division Zixibacteria bacterium]